VGVPPRPGPNQIYANLFAEWPVHAKRATAELFMTAREARRRRLERRGISIGGRFHVAPRKVAVARADTVLQSIPRVAYRAGSKVFKTSRSSKGRKGKMESIRF
jgi:hypothetical protein